MGSHDHGNSMEGARCQLYVGGQEESGGWGGTAMRKLKSPGGLGSLLFLPIKKEDFKGTWLAQLIERVTLDLRVVGLSPTLGVEIT